MANNSWNLLCMDICAILPPAGISINSLPRMQQFPLPALHWHRSFPQVCWSPGEQPINSAKCPQLSVELELFQHLNFWDCP